MNKSLHITIKIISGGSLEVDMTDKEYSELINEIQTGSQQFITVDIYTINKSHVVYVHKRIRL